MRLIKNFIKKYIPYFSDYKKNKTYRQLISKRFSKNDKPENLIYKFIKTSPVVLIKCDESKKLLEIIREKANDVFSKNQNKQLFKVATNFEDKLLETRNIKQTKEEIYRFLVDPLDCIPEVLELVLTESFQNTFKKIKLLKLSDVHLRLSSPNLFEKHTTGFHRDYNSFITLKVFIPLTANNDENFLEYFSSSLLKSTSNLHYRPRHLPFKNLKKKYRNLISDKVGDNDYAFPIVSTNCIHREIPSKTKKITLILTFLAHPGYGTFRPVINKKNIKNLDKLRSHDFLSLVKFKD